MSYAITDCYTMSFLRHVECLIYPNLTNDLVRLMPVPDKLDDDCMADMKKFAVLLYDQT